MPYSPGDSDAFGCFPSDPGSDNRVRKHSPRHYIIGRDARITVARVSTYFHFRFFAVLDTRYAASSGLPTSSQQATACQTGMKDALYAELVMHTMSAHAYAGSTSSKLSAAGCRQSDQLDSISRSVHHNHVMSVTQSSLSACASVYTFTNNVHTYSTEQGLDKSSSQHSRDSLSYTLFVVSWRSHLG